MDLPILGALSRNCGHFLVPYTKDDSFAVHREKMDRVDEEVDAHVADGGWLCFFPEGQLNKNPDKIQDIRHGGMKRAIKFDAIIVSLCYHGNENAWPLKAALGGFSCKVQWSLKEVAPDGAKAFVEKLVAKAFAEKLVDISDDDDGDAEPAQKKRKEQPDYEVLADSVAEFLQSHYDELKAESSGHEKAA